jgi:ribosome biogenesis GTPase A
MPKYKCTNKECPEYDKETTVAKVKMIYDKFTDSVIPSDPIQCRGCKTDLTYVKEEGPISINISTFNAMNPQEKRQMMHKRSQDHFKKTDKGDLANYKKSIIDNIKQKVERRQQ